MPEASVIHRALASPTRERLMEVLRAEAAPMSSQELGAAVDLHPNTVRSHLGILVNARLVACARRAPHGRGRPQHVYSAIDESHEVPAPLDGESYDLLATVLADRVRLDHSDVGSVVEDAAAAWAGRHVEGDLAPSTDEAVIERVLELLAASGFATRSSEVVDGSVSLVADRCPVAALARSHPDVACSFHRGVVRGLLSSLGGRVELAGLSVEPSGAGCRAVLRSAA